MSSSSFATSSNSLIFCSSCFSESIKSILSCRFGPSELLIKSASISILFIPSKISDSSILISSNLVNDLSFFSPNDSRFFGNSGIKSDSSRLISDNPSLGVWWYRSKLSGLSHILFFSSKSLTSRSMSFSSTSNSSLFSNC